MNERIEKADEHYKIILSRTLPEDKVLTLPECVAIAMENNFDLEANRLRDAIARERRTAEWLGMLPDLMITDDWHMRSNRPGSSSHSISTGGATYNYSQSSEKYEDVLRIEMAFSLIDFGLAYMNTVQATDRIYYEGEQLRRNEQNLKLEIVRTYFRVVTMQDAIEQTSELIETCRNIRAVLVELAREGQISTTSYYDELKRFIALEKRLIDFRRSYEIARVELCSKMGLMPSMSARIRLDTTPLRQVPHPELPSVEDMEKAALLERAELYSMDIQSHITLVEARKTLLLMLPNVRIFTDFNYSTNQFLYKSSFLELGVRAAYNLLKLPQQIARYRSLDTEVDEANIRTIANSAAIMAQVRIAFLNLYEMRKRYELDEEIFQIYKNHEIFVQALYAEGGAMSQLTADRTALETAEAEIMRTLALGEYYVAYYQLMNAIGIDDIDPDLIREIASKFDHLTEEQKESEDEQLEEDEELLESLRGDENEEETESVGE